MTNNALACSGVSVRFGTVQALRDVTVAFEPGKIHALLGQNGAGKSTLARVFSGLVSADTGQLNINGQRVAMGSPEAASNAGLNIVHQRFSLPPTFTIAEALEFASARKMGGAVFSAASIRQGWGTLMRDAGITVSPVTKLSDVPVETAQSLEILRALANDASVLILDEPTALLSLQAIDALFSQMRTLRDNGVSLIIILHKLREVMDIADTVSILREGNLVLPPTPTEDLSTGEISSLMIGEDVKAETRNDRASGTLGSEVLTLSSVNSAHSGVEPGLADISFTLRSGEILGIAGVEGNGQRQLAEVLCGLSPATGGKIQLDDTDITSADTAARRSLGLRSVPFDRMTEGAGLTVSLWENLQSWRASDFSRRSIVSTRKMRHQAIETLDKYGVVYGTIDDPGSALSGGNLQRVILAREFGQDVRLVIAAQPTRGLDFKATQFVWGELVRLKASGSGIILISSDLDEIFGIADRVMVMRGGAASGMFTSPFDRKQVGDAMVGAQR